MRITLRRVEDRVEIHLPEGSKSEFTELKAHYFEDVVDWQGKPRHGGLGFSLDALTRPRFGSDEGRIIITDSHSRGLMDDLYTPYPEDGSRANARLEVMIDHKRVDIPVRKGGGWEGHYEIVNVEIDA